MRRVVVTGMGIVSPIGHTLESVAESLRAARAGIVPAQTYAEMGFRSRIHGAPQLDASAVVDKRIRRFMGDGAAWNYVAMRDAIADAGLEENEVSSERTGIICGSGGPSTRNLLLTHDIARSKGPRRVGPFMVPRTMSSTNSATLATSFRIKGLNYSISSACSTSAHCIGAGCEQIQWGKQDVVFAGGGEELDWTLSVMFDAMGALSSAFNDTPAMASRAFDEARDGFVIAGGGGMVVLEALEHAKARGARIYAEITGYGATSDGYDMVQPSGEGAVRCMKMACAGMGGRRIDYVNAHGTSTPVGDLREIEALREVFGKDMPWISSTKSLTGHSLGAAGVQEVIYALLMMRGDFIAKSANIETLDPAFADDPIALERIDGAGLDSVLSNSFGFGGTNATIGLSRFEE